MKLQTLAELDQSLGGRKASGQRKKRIAFYLDADCVAALKLCAERQRVPISDYVRRLVLQSIQQVGITQRSE
ncbi:hypothetical protein ORJ04_17985 [Rheinheimera baltica]|uniref:Ribbon-helix-helix protein CopG domain-containing protein n=1 Tax=Rheinheimera baltica TaxID=67576 RepID=A0ABT9I379_9GAMM|nr:hypothetical protein [Rheinheimera baltica]MDP5137847.1 hypothetical protein [Rheinheimera baltica]